MLSNNLTEYECNTIVTIYLKKEDGEMVTGFMWLGIQPTLMNKVRKLRFS